MCTLFGFRWSTYKCAMICSTFVDMFGDTLGVLWGYFDIVGDNFRIVLQISSEVGQQQSCWIYPGVISPERG